jgi:hypothetical protein
MFCFDRERRRRRRRRDRKRMNGEKQQEIAVQI